TSVTTRPTTAAAATNGVNPTTCANGVTASYGTARTSVSSATATVPVASRTVRTGPPGRRRAVTCAGGRLVVAEVMPGLSQRRGAPRPQRAPRRPPAPAAPPRPPTSTNPTQHGAPVRRPRHEGRSPPDDGTHVVLDSGQGRARSGSTDDDAPVTCAVTGASVV